MATATMREIMAKVNFMTMVESAEIEGFVNSRPATGNAVVKYIKVDLGKQEQTQTNAGKNYVMRKRRLL